METVKNKRKKHEVHTNLKRLSVLLKGFLPFICYLIVLMQGISLIADSKTGLAFVNTVETNLAVRAYAGTDSMLLDRLPKNSQVLVTDAAVDGSGKTWYQVKYLRASDTWRTGYVLSTYIKFYNDIAAVGEDPDFEKYLEEQNFPESYKAPLRVLHKQHPTWIFQAQRIDLEWSTALYEESKVGVNMIHPYYAASWRSMEEGAYNWETQTWYELDTGCYGTSATINAYFLDPRNGLCNDTSIFQFEDLSYLPDSHSAENTFSIVKGTFLAGEYSFTEKRDDNFYPSYGIVAGSEKEDGTVTYKYSYVDTIMQAAKYAKVSPYHLASRLRQEMGTQGSPLAFGTYPGYEGYFNFYNIGAYAHSGRPARENGARYAMQSGSYLRPWTNPYKAILGGADFLGSSYIQKEQNTLYLQKFDVTDGGNGFYYHQYMSNVNAPADEASSLKKAYKDSGVLDNSVFTFNIPVYQNMPELAAAAPANDDKNATNNNWLSSITVSEGTLDKAFSRTTYEYTVTVPANISSVDISVNTCDSGATVLGTGKISLSSVSTRHVITVLAPSYELRTYTLNIVQSENIPATPIPTEPPVTTTTPTESPATPTPTSTPTPTPTPIPEPTIESSAYEIGTYITGVEPGTDVTKFLNHFTVKNGTIQFLNAAGASKGSGVVATGDMLQIYKGSTLAQSYPVVIYGDVNGDGKISLADMVMVQRQLLQIKILDGPHFTAMDTNHDKTCSLADMVIIQRHLLGIAAIKQR